MKFKRLLAVIMVISMTSGSCIFAQPLQTQAASKTLTKITVQPKKATIYVGKTKQLKVTKTPKAAKATIKWKSSNKKVAKVSKKGVVTGVKKGTVTIKATTKVKSKTLTAQCNVTVKNPIKVKSIKVPTTNVTLKVGNTTTIKPTIQPANATFKKLKYTSSNTKIATVNESTGLVTSKAAGTAYIKIAATDGSKKTAKVKITVNPADPIKAIGVNVSTPALSMGVGESRVVNAIVTPANANNKGVSYTSYDPEIATVDVNGLITARKEGRAELEIKTTDGSNKTAKVVVNVKPILATSISTGARDIGLQAGDKSQINVTFNPVNTTNRGLSFVSSDTSVVTVSETGLITGVKNGSATITVTTKDGSNKAATINVVVNPTSASSMTVSVSKPKIEMGEKIQIQSTITPASASIKSLKYTLINPLLDDDKALTAEAYDGYHAVTVSEMGIVEGIRRGPALIRVETVDGSNITKLIRLNVDWKASDKTGMRIFSTNDGEKDDIQSFRRFLLYTNEMDIEAIILSSSKYHAAGLPERVIDGVTYPPIESKSWVPERWINDLTAEYEEGYSNLVVHDPNYPTPDGIRAAISMGNVGYSGEMEASTDGSLMIKEALLDNDPRKVQFQVWGGTNTFARALMDIEEDYFQKGTWTGLNLTTGTYTDAVYTRGEFKFKDESGNNDPEKWAEWEAVVERVNNKAELYIIMGQDICYDTYVEKYWPGITSLYDNHVWGSMGYQSLNQGSYFYNWGYRGEFLNEHITTNHGALLGNYIQYGDNKILDNHKDNAQDGRWNKAEDPSYTPWTFIDEYGVERKAQKNTKLARGDMMSEGDSPSFIFALDRGLRTQENATWGGWSGRLGEGDRPTEFIDGGYDYCPTPFRPLDDPIANAEQSPWGWQRRHSASRWVGPLQTDFAVRADWFVTPNYEGANHMPDIKIVEGVDQEAVAGQRVLLNARTSDPDGDQVNIKWWHYGEADTYKERSKDGELADGSEAGRGAAPEMAKIITGGNSAYSAAVYIPSDAQPGDTIHVIAEATDNGAERGKDHNLKYYQRIVIKVTEACPVSLTPESPVVTGGEWNAETQTFTFNGTGTEFSQAFNATTGYGNINVGTGFNATTVIDGSSDTSVFTVTGSGTTATVTPVGAGTATLNATMTINDRSSVVSIRIKVVPPALTDIKASAANQKILVGESTSINVAPVPSNALLPTGNYTYKSSNELAATVSDTGIVTGVAKGPSTITITAPDGKTSETIVDVEWKNWENKPRTIVTTDGEVDDMDSFKRLLLYVNEIDVEAIVLNSSRWHHAGNAEAGVTPNRWNGTTWVYDDFDMYEKGYQNLRVHDPDYPTPDYLRSIYKIGNINNVGDVQHDSEGSLFVKDILLDDDPRPIQMQAWGGTNTIGRALMSIEEDYQAKHYPNMSKAEWEAKRDTDADWLTYRDALSSKMTIYIIQDQDGVYGSYVQPVWPTITIHYDSNNFGAFAYSWTKNSSYVDNQMLRANWMQENILKNHGPLMASYWTWGDGQLLPGEPDYEQRGMPSRATDSIYDENGNLVTADGSPATNGTYRYDFISEGDSPSYFALLDRGLRSDESPIWGGWYGRLTQGNRPTEYRDNALDYCATPLYVSDTNPWGWQKRYTLSRWFNPIQSEFGARADWLVTPNYEDANHMPDINIKEGINLTAMPGERVSLSAVTSDPDGDRVDVKWWHYGEADTYQEKDENGRIADGTAGKNGAPQMINVITGGLGGKTANFFIPADAKPGDTIHIIAEAVDNGKERGKGHNLTYYQRVVITVEGEIGVAVNLPDNVTDYWSKADRTYYALGTNGTTNTQRTFTASLAGGSTNLPTGNPSTAKPYTVAFTSSNANVATITTAGVITPVGNGITKITATVSYISGPSISTSVYINVEAPLVTDITISIPESVNPDAIPLGQDVTLTATVVPESAKQTLTWSSSDMNIATVSPLGIITPKNAGEVTITATSNDGSGKIAEIKFTIVESDNSETISGKKAENVVVSEAVDVITEETQTENGEVQTEGETQTESGEDQTVETEEIQTEEGGQQGNINLVTEGE